MISGIEDVDLNLLVYQFACMELQSTEYYFWSYLFV